MHVFGALSWSAAGLEAVRVSHAQNVGIIISNVREMLREEVIMKGRLQVAIIMMFF